MEEVEVREDLIIAALDALEQGHSIEEILDRYPQYADELRPILEAASGLGATVPLPTAAARQASRQALFMEAQRLREEQRGAKELPSWRRFFYSFASIAVLMALLGVILIPPAGEAIPGDILYPLKRGAEAVQLFVAPASEQDELRAAFDKERNREVYDMLEIGRDGQAGYVGIVEEIGDDYWQIGNITAIVNDETVINGDPEVGARVEAHCLVQDGQVIAESLTVLDPAPAIGPPAP